MAHVIACGDVIAGCAVVVEGDDEEQVLAHVAAHAEADHGIVDISPEVLEAVRAAIRST